MYHELTNSGLVTLTLTMLVNVLPYIVPSGSVPLIRVPNSTTDYLSNSTASTLLSAILNISESRTSMSPTENITIPVLLSHSPTAATSTLETTGTESSKSETTGIESSQLPSSVQSPTTSSFTFLRSLSTSSSSRSSILSVPESQIVNNVTSLELARNQSSSETSTQHSFSNTVTSSIPTAINATKGPMRRSALEIVLVKVGA